MPPLKSEGWPIHGWSSLQQFLQHCARDGRESERKEVSKRLRMATQLNGVLLWKAVIEEMGMVRGDDVAGSTGGVGLQGPHLKALDRLAANAIHKTATPTESVQFVYRCLGVDPRLIPDEMVPDSGAVELLRWARESESNRTTFLTSLWAKTISSKVSEAVGVFSEDTRAASSAIEEFERSLGGGE